jgi:hypothetical protein
MAEKKTAEQLERELLEAKAKIGDLSPGVVAKKKPYTKEEIKELEGKGHLIGAPHQKLSEGHDEEDLKPWDLCIVEILLKDIGKLPETGKEWSVPASMTVLKIEKTGMKASDQTFQWRNKQVDFRYPASEHRYIMHLPTGMFKPSVKYPCHYWVEEIKHAAGVQKEVRMLVVDYPIVTGAPEDKTKWGRG